MSERVVAMPAMTDAQAASWHAAMDLHEAVPDGWTLVGGQMVHLWCADRRSFVARPTDDVDAVLDEIRPPAARRGRAQRSRSGRPGPS